MLNDHLMPKTNRGLQTKNKLLRSAEYTFGKNGYHQSSITEITQYAGVSLGNFYTYFESKYQIFEALLMDMQGELFEVLKKRTSGLDKRIDIEREGFKAFFEFLKARPYWLSLFPQAEYVDKELHRKMIEKFARPYISRLEKSMENGEIRNLNTEMLVYSFMGIMNYIGLKWVLWDKKEVDDQLIDEIMDFIKQGIMKH